METKGTTLSNFLTTYTHTHTHTHLDFVSAPHNSAATLGAGRDGLADIACVSLLNEVSKQKL